MKDLKGLKKLLLIFSVIVLMLEANSDLDDYISNRKNLLFEYEDSINSLESDILKRSWINPIMINYYESRSNYTIFKDSVDKVFSININQPIFKSGGIFYAIEYANLTKSAKALGVYKKKRAMIAQALGVLYDLKKIKFQKKQLELFIKNDDIDIKRKKEQFEAGVIDISLLNQAILKRNEDKTRLLALDIEEQGLKNSFAILSDKNPDKLKLPKLKIIGMKKYIKKHIDIELDSLDIDLKNYNSKIVTSKYLPTVSLKADYYNTSSNIPKPDVRDSYHTIGIGVSMPIDINAHKDIEKSKVAYLKSMVQLQDDIKRVENEYKLIIKTVRIMDKKIALAKSDEKLYKSLPNYTKEQLKAGNKTKFDLLTIKNSLKISKLDKLIYLIEKQKQLLKLYENIK